MASLIEQRNVYRSPCNELAETIKRELGSEFTYPAGVLIFATIPRQILRYFF
jgi:hypothetical protein